MKFTVRHAWEWACHELSAIIYGTYLRRKLKPSFSKTPWERITPYLFHSNEFNSKKKIVLFPAFFPSLKKRRKSVYWTSRLADYFVWSIGERHVVPFRGPIKGRADLPTSFVYAIPGLAIKLTSKPHPRHADILGWHTDRRMIRLQAEKLADDASLMLIPPGFSVRREDIDEDRRRLRIAGVVLLLWLI